MHPTPKGTGWIEVICGSMFSGKTQELIRRLRLARIARQNVQVFKPKIDKRYSRSHIVSHDRVKIPSVVVDKAGEILKKVDPLTEVIGIDEAHFFGAPLPGICEKLADKGRRVIVAGLEQDYKGKPFTPIAQLMAVSEYVTKNLAICVVCGSPANRSQRIGTGKKRIELGHTDKYEARCRRCFTAEG